MIRRIVATLVTIAALAALACVDMSAPNGAASISQLILPSPSVVVGDTMRDSTGAVAGLRVIAYDGSDTPIQNAESQFFLTDSTNAAHLANSSLLIGDKQGSVRVVGQVFGIQTAPATALVSVAPTKFALATTPALPDTFFVPLTKTGDTTTASTGTQPIVVTLKGVGDTASLGFIVKYQLVSAPATKPGAASQAVFIGVDASKPSLVDTTKAAGSTRSVIVRTGLLPDGFQRDSVVVSISTFYKGKPVAGSPIRVTLPIKLKLAIAP